MILSIFVSIHESKPYEKFLLGPRLRGVFYSDLRDNVFQYVIFTSLGPWNLVVIRNGQTLEYPFFHLVAGWNWWCTFVRVADSCVRRFLNFWLPIFDEDRPQFGHGTQLESFFPECDHTVEELAWGGGTLRRSVISVHRPQIPSQIL